MATGQTINLFFILFSSFSNDFALYLRSLLAFTQFKIKTIARVQVTNNWNSFHIGVMMCKWTETPISFERIRHLITRFGTFPNFFFGSVSKWSENRLAHYTVTIFDEICINIAFRISTISNNTLLLFDDFYANVAALICLVPVYERFE